jgi:hypothetical protein
MRRVVVLSIFVTTFVIGAYGMQAAAQQECDRQAPSFVLNQADRCPLYPGTKFAEGTFLGKSGSVQLGPRLRFDFQNGPTRYPVTPSEEWSTGYRLSYTFESQATMSVGKWRSRERDPNEDPRNDPGHNLPRKDTQVYYGVGGTIPF